MKKLLLILALALSSNAWSEEVVKTYYSSGELSAEAEYIQGKKGGAYKKYHKNGNVESIGQYLDDKKSGLWYFFAKDGTLVQEGTYVQDKENGLWKTYFNSEQKEKKLFELIQYENGLANGIAATFHPDGKTVRCKISYVTGVIHGGTESFFSNGNIRSVMPFSKGRMDGKGYVWDEEGKRLFGFKYHNGNFREKNSEYYCEEGKRKRKLIGMASWVGAKVVGHDRCIGKNLKELGLGKIEGKKGTNNAFTWFNFLSCGDAGWTKGELSDDS